MRAAPRLGVAAGTAGQHGLAAHAAGVDRAERGGGEGGEHARVRGDRLGDALASGQARADELAGVALVDRRAGRADGFAAVAAREWSTPPCRRAGASSPVARSIMSVRWRSWIGCEQPPVGGELAFPAAEVGAGGRGGVVGGRPRSRARDEGSGSEGGCRGGHGCLAPALLGGLAGDAEPGADLGPGVAEARRPVTAWPMAVSISPARLVMAVRASTSPSATRRA